MTLNVKKKDPFNIQMTTNKDLFEKLKMQFLMAPLGDSQQLSNITSAALYNHIALKGDLKRAQN